MVSQNQMKRILNDLYLFYRVFITKDYAESVEASHIDLLSQKLTRLYLGESMRLCVSMPPRHSKSSIVTLAFPLWLIFQDPSLNILVVNSSANLSEKFGIQLKEHVRKYGHLFGLYLSDIKQAKNYLMFCDEDKNLYNGSIRLVGANGSITGTEADYLIVDDPYKGFEDITPTLLQKKIDWFQNIILQRLEPQSRLVICHTRWSNSDLQGFLRENYPDQYEFISFPAIKGDGSSLWPERYSPEFLEARRVEMGSRLFESLYQQNPLDETSDFFDLDRIDYDPRYSQEDILYSVRSWDIASSEAAGADYTAGVLMHKLSDGRYVISDLKHGHFGGNNLRVIQSTARSDGAGTRVFIETGVGAAGELLYKEWHKQLKGFRLEQAKPVKSKVDRATPLQNAVLDGEVCLELPEKERGLLLREFRGFPDAVHDDIVDAASYCFNYLHRKVEGLDEVPTYINIW